MLRRSPSLICLALAGATLAGASSASAQGYYPPPPGYPYQPDDRAGGYADEDIVIYGRYGPRVEDAESASTVVSYADLDLYYPEDRRELRRRVSTTARYLCERLGESDGGLSYGTSCRDTATRDALRRVGTVEAGWAPRGTAWVR